MKVVKPIISLLALTAVTPLAAQTTKEAEEPTAPPVVRTISPPPPIMIPRPIAAPVRAEPRQPVRLQVEILGGRERLWSGTLLVGGYRGASYTSIVSETPETCPADKSDLGRYAPDESRSIRLNIAQRFKSDDNEVFSVDASWTRPGVACQEGGSSTVGFNRLVALDANGRAQASGDGGLVVKISRIK